MDDQYRDNPQNADGQAHLAYFDKKTDTSYVWDGKRNTIQVCPGGYGEPYTRTIPAPEIPNRLIDFYKVLEDFEDLCQLDAVKARSAQEGQVVS